MGTTEVTEHCTVEDYNSCEKVAQTFVSTEVIVESCPKATDARSQMQGLAPRSQKWNPEQRSPPELTEPFITVAKRPPDLHQQAL